jgi:hypothetical protein
MYPGLLPGFLTPYSVEIDLTASERDVLDEISSRWSTSDKIVLFEDLSERFGRDFVGRIIDRVVAAAYSARMGGNGRKEPSNNLDDFIRLLWEPLPAAGFDVSIEHMPEGVQIHCTRCPHADIGRRNNAAFWFYHLVCSGDPYAAAGFNPRIGFRRTQTLMEGHPCCDHFYFIKP